MNEQQIKTTESMESEIRPNKPPGTVTSSAERACGRLPYIKNMAATVTKSLEGLLTYMDEARQIRKTTAEADPRIEQESPSGKNTGVRPVNAAVSTVGKLRKTFEQLASDLSNNSKEK